MGFFQMPEKCVGVDDDAFPISESPHVQLLSPGILHCEDHESLFHVEGMHQATPDELVEFVRIVRHREVPCDERGIGRLVTLHRGAGRCVPRERVNGATDQDRGTHALPFIQTRSYVLVDVYAEVLAEATYPSVTHGIPRP